MSVRRTASARRTASRGIAATAVGVLMAVALPTGALADDDDDDDGCDEERLSYAQIMDCVTLEGVREHQKAFQRIADRSKDPVYPDSRAAGTEGYAKSVQYVVDQLEDADYAVTLDPVEFLFFYPSTLAQTAPSAAEFEINIATGSGFGTIADGKVIPVDINLTGTRANTSGCEASDFQAQDFSGAEDIALVQRGTCPFAQKAQLAEENGAEAVVIFNQGNPNGADDRFGAVNPTLGTYEASGPVVGTSFAAGESLARAGSTADLEVIEPETRTDYNVIAEKRGKNRNNVVMAGAHLDSVTAGPGINDNGSGSAALLETALQMEEFEPQNTLRFAWWAAEEEGLLGSRSYVQKLADQPQQTELKKIALYMNYDMIGSPNHYFGVYDSDESSFKAPTGVQIPPGSQAIEDVYESFYTKVGQPYDDSEYSGRSDYQAFINNGVPSGGLFTGAEVRKTAEQAEIWGGTAGEQFDPCYHLACDTFANNNDEALDVNSDLVAFAMLHFAYSTESVNGVKGKPVPGRYTTPAPAGPEKSFPGALGGKGVHDDHDHDHEGEPS